MTGALGWLMAALMSSNTARVQLSGGVNSFANGNPTVAGYGLSNLGVEFTDDNGTETTIDTWLLSGSASDYDCRMTIVSGSMGGSATGSWLNLGSKREWNVTDTTVLGGPVSASGTVEIRDASTLVVLAGPALVSLEAERIV